MAKALVTDKSNDVGDIAKRFNVHRSTLYRLTQPDSKATKTGKL